MSQSDFDVANASGATVRADINAHLDAMVTLSSGTSAPSPAFPNQWWVDTSTNILKQRNNANTLWVIFADTVNVKDYGALGDGAADDTSEIQAASDAGAGKIIFFPTGVYIVTSLTVTNKQHWQLAPGAVIKQKNNADVNLLTINVDGWSMEGGKIDGNKANQGTPQNTITVNNDDVTIRRVEIRDSGNYGIVFRDCSHCIADGCKIWDSDDLGIFGQVISAGVDQDDILITNCLIDRSSLNPATINNGGILVAGDDSTLKFFRGRVVNNYIKMPVNPTSNTAGGLAVFGLGRLSVVSGNTITGGSISISLGRGDFTTIVGNTVDNMNLIGIELADGDDCIVSGNVIDGNGLCPTGIQLSSPGVVLRCVIAGNTISGCTDRGIQATAATQLTISGNSVFMAEAPGFAVQVIDSTHVAITGNVLDGNALGERAVDLNKTDRMVISGNNMFNFSAFGVVLVASGAFTFTNIAINGNNFNTVTVPIGISLSNGGALGAEIRAFGNTGLTRNNRKYNYFDILNDLIEVWHTGTPEAAVVANIGSIYHRTDGGAATTLYIKETGTGNTGWAAK